MSNCQIFYVIVASRSAHSFRFDMSNYDFAEVFEAFIAVKAVLGLSEKPYLSAAKFGLGTQFPKTSRMKLIRDHADAGPVVDALRRFLLDSVPTATIEQMM